MKHRKECLDTQDNKLNTINRWHSGAGTFYTSSADAVISLILMRKDRLFIASPIVASILIASLSLSLFTGATNLFGLNGSAYADYTISMALSGVQSINVSPDASGVGTSISVDAVTVTTTCPAGYNLSISTSVNDNKIYLNGDSSNNTNGTYFNPSNGSTALSSAPNTWGFYQEGSNVPTSSSIFKPVPISTSTPATIRTTSSTSDSFNIYYGVAVENDLTAGTYKMIPDTNDPNNSNGTVRYYLTMNESCIPYLVVFNANGGSGTMNNQQIYKDTATPLNTNTYSAPFGKEFKEWNTKSDGTGTSYQDQQSVTNLTTPGNTITLYAIWRVPPTPLYNLVANQSKGTQTLADMQAVITKPTSDYSTGNDTSNSGVYEYDASTFGTASDAANTSKIYYYRGILDSNLTNDSKLACDYVGTCGDGFYYPNYVVLSSASDKYDLAKDSDTCWRIVRTTGSGGVKMIYNGKWTGSTCANTAVGATGSSVYLNRGTPSTSANDYGTQGFITYVGYNYNSTYGYNNTSYTSAVNNSALFTNNTKSNLRTELESWYVSNMTAYSSILETSAGWCNDRTTYTPSGSETTTTIPYYTSMPAVKFGAYYRNLDQGNKLSLTCPDITGNDLLTTSNGMTYPAAPLTTDEVALAGSGYGGRTSATTYSSNYHYNSYLRSTGNFWLLSPYYRTAGGKIYVFVLDSNAELGHESVDRITWVRPSISLTSGTTAVSGTGTAADPWIVNP